MSNIKKAAEFGKRMGKLAANNQFIGPKAPANVPTGGYLNYYRNQPTFAAQPQSLDDHSMAMFKIRALRNNAEAASMGLTGNDQLANIYDAFLKANPNLAQRPAANLPYRPIPAKDTLMPYLSTPTNTQIANKMLSGKIVPQGMREKDYVMGLDKSINQRMSNARPGTVAGELERQQGESSAKAINTMASTLGTMGAGHAIGHGISPAVNKTLGLATSGSHPVVQAAAPHVGKHISDLAGHFAASRGVEAIGGSPIHLTTAPKPQLGIAMDAAKAIPSFMRGKAPHAMAGIGK